MRLNDLSVDSRALISALQFSQTGKKPEAVFALALALSTTPESLPYVDYKNEEGIYRSQIIEKSYKDRYMTRDIEILNELLNLVVFDFESVLELAPKLYALRYLQAYDSQYFLNTFNEVSEKNYINTGISSIYYKIASEYYFAINDMSIAMRYFIKDFEAGRTTNGQS